ncbi:conserved protein, unknown function [Plasmodium gallinaceum]|uniref:Tyrosine-protein kinase ephrin type A/B receptor-like domain-containing protein n=1 Tax=Plasmodium gallinaceum TaxID=5849 RepID=A0A1J1GVX4_PLAGA|nr:conserved protein, unknown function [Plasmodium gallinaceum]CRG96587.1 conserved protein, unknown function [Plasmodium gallinaceum]
MFTTNKIIFFISLIYPLMISIVYLDHSFNKISNVKKFRLLDTVCNAGEMLTYDYKCEKCKIGFYNFSRVNKQCFPCPLGTFTDKMGSLICQNCPKGSSTNEMESKSILDCICNKGFKLDKINNKCMKCNLIEFCHDNKNIWSFQNMCIKNSTVKYRELCESVKKKKIYDYQILCHKKDVCLNFKENKSCLKGNHLIQCKICEENYRYDLISPSKNPCVFCNFTTYLIIIYFILITLFITVSTVICVNMLREITTIKIFTTYIQFISLLRYVNSNYDHSFVNIFYFFTIGIPLNEILDCIFPKGTNSDRILKKINFLLFMPLLYSFCSVLCTIAFYILRKRVEVKINNDTYENKEKISYWGEDNQRHNVSLRKKKFINNEFHQLFLEYPTKINKKQLIKRIKNKNKSSCIRSTRNIEKSLNVNYTENTEKLTNYFFNKHSLKYQGFYRKHSLNRAIITKSENFKILKKKKKKSCYNKKSIFSEINKHKLMRSNSDSLKLLKKIIHKNELVIPHKKKTKQLDIEKNHNKYIILKSHMSFIKTYLHGSHKKNNKSFTEYKKNENENEKKKKETNERIEQNKHSSDLYSKGKPLVNIIIKSLNKDKEKIVFEDRYEAKDKQDINNIYSKNSNTKNSVYKSCNNINKKYVNYKVRNNCVINNSNCIYNYRNTISLNKQENNIFDPIQENRNIPENTVINYKQNNLMGNIINENKIKDTFCIKHMLKYFILFFILYHDLLYFEIIRLCIFFFFCNYDEHRQESFIIIDDSLECSEMRNKYYIKILIIIIYNTFIKFSNHFLLLFKKYMKNNVNILYVVLQLYYKIEALNPANNFLLLLFLVLFYKRFLNTTNTSLTYNYKNTLYNPNIHIFQLTIIIISLLIYILIMYLYVYEFDEKGEREKNEMANDNILYHTSSITKCKENTKYIKYKRDIEKERNNIKSFNENIKNVNLNDQKEIVSISKENYRFKNDIDDKNSDYYINGDNYEEGENRKKNSNSNRHYNNKNNKLLNILKKIVAKLIKKKKVDKFIFYFSLFVYITILLSYYVFLSYIYLYNFLNVITIFSIILNFLVYLVILLLLLNYFKEDIKIFVIKNINKLVDYVNKIKWINWGVSKQKKVILKKKISKKLQELKLKNNEMEEQIVLKKEKKSIKLINNILKNSKNYQKDQLKFVNNFVFDEGNIKKKKKNIKRYKLLKISKVWVFFICNIVDLTEEPEKCLSILISLTLEKNFHKLTLENCLNILKKNHFPHIKNISLILKNFLKYKEKFFNTLMKKTYKDYESLIIYAWGMSILSYCNLLDIDYNLSTILLYVSNILKKSKYFNNIMEHYLNIFPFFNVNAYQEDIKKDTEPTNINFHNQLFNNYNGCTLYNLNRNDMKKKFIYSKELYDNNNNNSKDFNIESYSLNKYDNAINFDYMNKNLCDSHSLKDKIYNYYNLNNFKEIYLSNLDTALSNANNFDIHLSKRMLRNNKNTTEINQSNGNNENDKNLYSFKKYLNTNFNMLKKKYQNESMILSNKKQNNREFKILKNNKTYNNLYKLFLKNKTKKDNRGNMFDINYIYSIELCRIYLHCLLLDVGEIYFNICYRYTCEKYICSNLINLWDNSLSNNLYMKRYFKFLEDNKEYEYKLNIDKKYLNSKKRDSNDKILIINDFLGRNVLDTDFYNEYEKLDNKTKNYFKNLIKEEDYLNTNELIEFCEVYDIRKIEKEKKNENEKKKEEFFKVFSNALPVFIENSDYLDIDEVKLIEEKKRNFTVLYGNMIELYGDDYIMKNYEEKINYFQIDNYGTFIYIKGTFLNKLLNLVSKKKKKRQKKENNKDNTEDLLSIKYMKFLNKNMHNYMNYETINDEIFIFIHNCFKCNIGITGDLKGMNFYNKNSLIIINPPIILPNKCTIELWLYFNCKNDKKKSKNFIFCDKKGNSLFVIDRDKDTIENIEIHINEWNKLSIYYIKHILKKKTDIKNDCSFYINSMKTKKWEKINKILKKNKWNLLNLTKSSTGLVYYINGKYLSTISHEVLNLDEEFEISIFGNSCFGNNNIGICSSFKIFEFLNKDEIKRRYKFIKNIKFKEMIGDNINMNKENDFIEGIDITNRQMEETFLMYFVQSRTHRNKVIPIINDSSYKLKIYQLKYFTKYKNTNYLYNKILDGSKKNDKRFTEIHKNLEENKKESKKSTKYKNEYSKIIEIDDEEEYGYNVYFKKIIKKEHLPKIYGVDVFSDNLAFGCNLSKFYNLVLSPTLSIYNELTKPFGYTISAWVFLPIVKNISFSSLICGENDIHVSIFSDDLIIGCIENYKKKDKIFYHSSGYSIKNLNKGWYYLNVVGTLKGQFYFINGCFKGCHKFCSFDNIKYIFNSGLYINPCSFICFLKVVNKPLSMNEILYEYNNSPLCYNFSYYYYYFYLSSLFSNLTNQLKFDSIVSSSNTNSSDYSNKIQFVHFDVTINNNVHIYPIEKSKKFYYSLSLTSMKNRKLHYFNSINTQYNNLNIYLHNYIILPQQWAILAVINLSFINESTYHCLIGGVDGNSHIAINNSDLSLGVLTNLKNEIFYEKKASNENEKSLNKDESEEFYSKQSSSEENISQKKFAKDNDNYENRYYKKKSINNYVKNYKDDYQKFYTCGYNFINILDKNIFIATRCTNNEQTFFVNSLKVGVSPACLTPIEYIGNCLSTNNEYISPFGYYKFIRIIFDYFSDEQIREFYYSLKL